MQFIHFTMVGSVATAIQYAILIALVRSELAGAVSASCAGFALGAAANYALNRRFTFRSSRPHVQTLPRFAIVALLGLAVNAGLMWLSHVPLGLHYLAAQVLATLGTLVWTFTLNRAWTFSPFLPRYRKEAP